MRTASIWGDENNLRSILRSIMRTTKRSVTSLLNRACKAGVWLRPERVRMPHGERRPPRYTSWANGLKICHFYFSESVSASASAPSLGSPAPLSPSYLSARIFHNLGIPIAAAGPAASCGGWGLAAFGSELPFERGL